MKVKVPSVFTTIVPTFGMVSTVPITNGPVTPAIVYPVTVKVLPSPSVSLVKTFPVTGVSSGVVTVSSTATGALLNTATVIDTVAVAHTLP